MPRVKNPVKNASVKNESVKKIRWGESYTSLLLGIIVVVVAFLLVFSIIKNHNYNLQNTSSLNTEEEAQLPETYEVKQGENLWAISEKIYKSGYNWVDLASANKIQNPDLIETGQKLSVPKVEPKLITEETQPEPIKGDTYTVKEGDNLWEISVRAYGDGFKWTEVSKANKVTNPDLIFAGSVLKLPR